VLTSFPGPFLTNSHEHEKVREEEVEPGNKARIVSKIPSHVRDIHYHI
jgi:hypothetical protein